MFQETSYGPLAQLDEDVDLTTGLNGVTIAADSISTWRENVIPFRGRGTDNQRDNAAWVGWNRRIAGPDTMKFGQVARLTITIPDSVVRAWNVSDRGAVYLSVAPTKDKPGPRAAPRDTTKRDTSKAAVEARAKAAPDSARPPPKPPKPNPAPTPPPVHSHLEAVEPDAHPAPTKPRTHCAHRATFGRGLHLLTEFLNREFLTGRIFGLELLGGIGIKSFLGLFGQCQDIAHSQDSRSHALWIENIEI